MFQYIPLLEEETHAQKVELAKKAKTNESGDGDSDDTDTDGDDEDSEQELYYFSSQLQSSFLSTGKQHLFHRNNLYSYLLESKDTPPPKI